VGPGSDEGGSSFSVISRKVEMASLHSMYRVFGPGASKFAFPIFSFETNMMLDETICRFVVVSHR